jgi:hypothetical protein
MSTIKNPIEHMDDEEISHLALTLRNWRYVRTGHNVGIWYDEENNCRNIGTNPVTNPYDFSNYKYWAQDKYGMVISLKSEQGCIIVRAYIRTPKFLVGQCSVRYRTQHHTAMVKAEQRATLMAIIKVISQETIGSK